MKIPSERLDEIRQRHEAGQSDPQIAVWLAGLVPAVFVTPDAIRKARSRAGIEKSADKPETSAKPSGAANRKRQAAERSQEAADHEARGGVCMFDVAAQPTVMTSHIYALEWGTKMLELIRNDPLMTAPDKSRHGAMWVNAIAKVRVDAEIEAEMDAIRADRARELAEMQEQEQELEREKKRLQALRRELEERLASAPARPKTAN